MEGFPHIVALGYRTHFQWRPGDCDHCDFGLRAVGGTLQGWGYFSKVGVLLKSGGTFQEWEDFSKVGVLSKSGETLGESEVMT